MAPPLSIPGYAFDPATNRYFKQPTSTAKLTPSQSRPPPSSSSSSARGESEGRKRKRARKTVEKGKWTTVEPNLWGLRELSTRGNWEGNGGKREKLHQCAFLSLFQSTTVLTATFSTSSDLRLTSLSRSTTIRTLFPDCLPLDDEITHLSFDERSPSVLRIGCGNGSIACVLSFLRAEALIDGFLEEQNRQPLPFSGRERLLPQRRRRVEDKLVPSEQSHVLADLRRSSAVRFSFLPL